MSRLEKIRNRIEEIDNALKPLSKEREELEYERSKLCNCVVLQKTLASNWSFFKCVKCGKPYFSSGNAKVLDFSKEDKKKLEEFKKQRRRY